MGRVGAATCSDALSPQEDLAARGPVGLPEGRVLPCAGHRPAVRHRAGGLLPGHRGDPAGAAAAPPALSPGRPTPTASGTRVGQGPGGCPGPSEESLACPSPRRWGGRGSGAGSTHPDPEGSCLHGHWDQCLIYVEISEVFTFLEPALPQLPPDPAPPGSELVSGWGPPGVGWASWTLPSRLPARPEARPSSTRGPAQTYLLTRPAPVALPSPPSTGPAPAAALTSASLAGGSGSPAPVSSQDPSVLIPREPPDHGTQHPSCWALPPQRRPGPRAREVHVYEQML